MVVNGLNHFRPAIQATSRSHPVHAAEAQTEPEAPDPLHHPAAQLSGEEIQVRITFPEPTYSS